jgi:hypothetical protein
MDNGLGDYTDQKIMRGIFLGINRNTITLYFNLFHIKIAE